MGGVFYPALRRHMLRSMLDLVKVLMGIRLGSISFGGISCIFRNKAIVYPKYGDPDLGRIYKLRSGIASNCNR